MSLQMNHRHITAMLLIASLLSGCATPPNFVTASEVVPEQRDRVRALDCEKLAIELVEQERFDQEMSNEMSGRVATQLALNVVGVAALAVGGVGFGYSLRGESGMRRRLAYIRSEVILMRSTMIEKGCRPVTSGSQSPVVDSANVVPTKVE